MNKTLIEENELVSLENESESHYVLKGVLSFSTVPPLWQEHNDDIFENGEGDITIDLSGVERSDSSGLALLVEWHRNAVNTERKIIFYNLPQQMMDIARVSGLDELLPLARRK